MVMRGSKGGRVERRFLIKTVVRESDFWRALAMGADGVRVCKKVRLHDKVRDGNSVVQVSADRVMVEAVDGSRPPAALRLNMQITVWWRRCARRHRRRLTDCLHVLERRLAR